LQDRGHVDRDEHPRSPPPGRTALDLARERGFTAMVELLAAPR
jgi:hypothetical protein